MTRYHSKMRKIVNFFDCLKTLRINKTEFNFILLVSYLDSFRRAMINTFIHVFNINFENITAALFKHLDLQNEEVLSFSVFHNEVFHQLIAKARTRTGE